MKQYIRMINGGIKILFEKSFWIYTMEVRM